MTEEEKESVEVVPGIDVDATNEGRKKSPSTRFIFYGSFFMVFLVAAAIVAPNIISGRSRGQHIACRSNLKNISTALEMYSTDWSGKYPVSMSTLTPNYLKTIPECPAAGTETYSAGYRIGKNAPLNADGWNDYYYVECHGTFHKPVGYPPNRPAYNGIVGIIEK